MRWSQPNVTLGLIATLIPRCVGCSAAKSLGFSPARGTVVYEEASCCPANAGSRYFQYQDTESGLFNTRELLGNNESLSDTDALADDRIWREQNPVKGTTRHQKKTHKRQPLWEIRPSPGKGDGVFARTPIPSGTRIMVEEPLIAIHLPTYHPGKGYIMEEITSLIDGQVDALDDEGKDAFYSCHEYRLPQEEVEALDGDDASQRHNKRSNIPIFRSNAYSLPDGRSALFPRIAKINHSCQPNVANVWSAGSGRRIVWAARDIAEGEELFASYVPLLQDAATRQKRLAQYGFRCGCDACSTASSLGFEASSAQAHRHHDHNQDQDHSSDTAPKANKSKGGMQEEATREEMVQDSDLRRSRIATLFTSVREGLDRSATPVASSPLTAKGVRRKSSTKKNKNKKKKKDRGSISRHGDVAGNGDTDFDDTRIPNSFRRLHRRLGEAEELASLLEEEHMADYFMDACRLVAELAYRVGEDAKAAEWLRTEIGLRLNAMVIIDDETDDDDNGEARWEPEGGEEDGMSKEGEEVEGEGMTTASSVERYEALVDQWVENEPVVKEALRLLDLAEGVIVAEGEGVMR